MCFRAQTAPASVVYGTGWRNGESGFIFWQKHSIFTSAH